MSIVKYQIFISSTYVDLIEERDEVIKACLEMGHIPIGMEMFSAADEEQWKIITREIDDSDYFVVIIAHRYGSEVKGISYTEKEYDYAISKGIPILGFIIDSKVQWLPIHVDKDKKTEKKLNAFKQKVKLKPVKHWKNKDELHALCVTAIGKSIGTHRRPGWIRTSSKFATQVTNYEINTVYNGDENNIESLKAEIQQLRLENFRLKNALLLITKPTHQESVSRIMLIEGFVRNTNVKIWPIVRTVSGHTYWVQSLGDVSTDGRWRAKVVIGTIGTSDVGARYQLVVVVNPDIELHEGDELTDWPDAEYKSEPIEIIRN